jgi:hypothetical protein
MENIVQPQKKHKKNNNDQEIIDSKQPEKISLTAEMNQYEMQKILKNTNIEIRRTFFWNHENEEKLFPEEYPITLDYPCLSCGKIFDSIPIFRIYQWNEKKNIPIFQPSEFYCGLVCYKNNIIEGSINEKGTHLQNLFRFALRYLDENIDTISYLPLSFMKSRSPCGFLTDEEWKSKSKRYYGFYIHPPFQFVDTANFISEKPIFQRTAKELGYKLNFNVTTEQQKTYEENIEKAKKTKSSQTNRNQPSSFFKHLGFKF